MKVIVQIPCLNEAETLPLVMADMPRKIPGVDVLEYMIIDDGCTDDTVKVAKKLGIHHIVTHTQWQGLARAFRNGTDRALELGADIVVNTDGDNQYPQGRIPDLIKPILEGRAEIVIADRQTSKIAHFSPAKKLFQRFGSWVVNKAAGTDIPDAASGFRAYSKSALLRLNIITQFSYCMETTIQAGNKRIPIVSIPIETNAKTRESRLFKNSWEHVFKSMTAIIRAYIMYRPYVVIGTVGTLLAVAGLVPFIRYVVLFIIDRHPGAHLQSLILGSALLMGAFICVALAVLADLIRTNRILHEETLEQIRTVRFGAGSSSK
ncbi:MAG TPA: glycosyltransferase family 2 protein [Candidatus Saccharimonadales bacterium]|nr:glycosyltransferase family 2 protein [Candidatus Saccharimonadales bacterium]